MLIKCYRHTKEDLELWKEYEEADLIYYESRKERFKEKEKIAIEDIKSFAKKNKCYASVSWGKDSTVLAHLVYRSCVDIPLFHIRQIPTENPHTREVRNIFLKKYNIRYFEGIADYRNISMKLVESEQEKMKDKMFYKQFRIFSTKNGNHYMSGIRRDESVGRKFRIIKGSKISISLAPIGQWSLQDIFSYLLYYNLPVHPNYAMLGAGIWERKRVRVDELMGERGNASGRREWEMEYYKDILMKIAGNK